MIPGATARGVFAWWDSAFSSSHKDKGPNSQCHASIVSCSDSLTLTGISSTVVELDRGAAAMSSRVGFPESAWGTRAKGAFSISRRNRCYC